MSEEMLPQEIYLICPPNDLHQQTISVESGQNNQMKSILVTDNTDGFNQYQDDLVKKETIDDEYAPVADMTYHNCPLCQSSFMVKAHLFNHLQAAHGMVDRQEGNQGNQLTDPNFQISLPSFQQQQQLQQMQVQQHFQPATTIQINKKTFACHLCDKQFTQACNLKTHMRVHSGERPYECKECLRQFTNKVNLQTHIRTHTGEKPFTCDTCNSQFTQVSSLKVHMRSHTGERPYLCKTCSRGFTKSSDLNRHIKTHLVERPHKCRVCMRGFTQINSLQMHMRLHTNYRPYTCFLCDKRFARISCLKAHTKLHTDLSVTDQDRQYNRQYLLQQQQQQQQQHYNNLQQYQPAQDQRNYYDFVNEVNKADDNEDASESDSISNNSIPRFDNNDKTASNSSPTPLTTTDTTQATGDECAIDADHIDSATIERIMRHHGEYDRVVMPEII